jgi:hypothetical protein
MRLLFMTLLASLRTTILGLFSVSATVPIWRRETRQRQSCCRHFRMNESSHPARLCMYCYWTLPGSRVNAYHWQG